MSVCVSNRKFLHCALILKSLYVILKLLITFQKSKRENQRYETEDERAALAYYEMMKKGRNSDEENEE